MKTSKSLQDRRKRRARHHLRQKANGRARLSVHRSSEHIYAQIIDDLEGRTVAAASSLEKDLKGAGTGADKNAAAKVGELVAKRALEAGVDTVVFDRGGYKYHGRVQALGDAAREAGLNF